MRSVITVALINAICSGQGKKVSLADKNGFSENFDYTPCHQGWTDCFEQIWGMKGKAIVQSGDGFDGYEIVLFDQTDSAELVLKGDEIYSYFGYLQDEVDQILFSWELESPQYGEYLGDNGWDYTDHSQVELWAKVNGREDTSTGYKQQEKTQTHYLNIPVYGERIDEIRVKFGNDVDEENPNYFQFNFRNMDLSLELGYVKDYSEENYVEDYSEEKIVTESAWNSYDEEWGGRGSSYYEDRELAFVIVCVSMIVLLLLAPTCTCCVATKCCKRRYKANRCAKCCFKCKCKMC